MGVINTGNFPRALLPGVNQWVGMGYAKHEAMWDKIFDKQKSNRNYEFDVATTPTGLVPVKAEGAGITYDTMNQFYETRYTHVVYASGIIITREEMEDDLYGVVGPKRAMAMGQSFAVNKERICADVLNHAFSSSYLGGDGKALCATDHPITGGTFSNTPSVASDLSESALEQAYIDIYNLVDNRGKPILVKPTKLIIPVALKFEAQRILKSDFRVATADNDTNALKDFGFFQDVLCHRYLTDTDAWFIKTDCPDGLKYFERRAMEVANDNDFDTENLKFKVTERYSVGFTDARGVYGSPGA